MNRIKLSPLAHLPLDALQPSTQPPPPDSASPTTERYQRWPNLRCVESGNNSLFVPLHYEQNYPYPLLVWLHSNGDDAGELHRVMPAISLQNYVAVAPQAALGDVHCGYYWEQDLSSIDYSADAVLAAVDHARRRANICSQKIFIAGYGAAGTMAFRVALTHPDVFAGVASMHGPLPQGSAPMGRWCSSRNLEVFWCHYRHCDEFRQNDLCQQLKLLHIAGFSVTLRQYPPAEELTTAALADLNRWIMQLFDSTIA